MPLLKPGNHQILFRCKTLFGMWTLPQRFAQHHLRRKSQFVQRRCFRLLYRTHELTNGRRMRQILFHKPSRIWGRGSNVKNAIMPGRQWHRYHTNRQWPHKRHRGLIYPPVVSKKVRKNWKSSSSKRYLTYFWRELSFLAWAFCFCLSFFVGFGDGVLFELSFLWVWVFFCVWEIVLPCRKALERDEISSLKMENHLE